MSAETLTEPVVSLTGDQAHDWVVYQLVLIGFEGEDAERMAKERVDYALARALHSSGCPLSLIARII